MKLHASILTSTEIEYNIKVAKALGITCLVVASTVPQAMTVLDEVASLQALVVSGRNHRLWKVDPGKTMRILQDMDVASKIAERKANDAIILIAEGFTAGVELVAAREMGVDAVILGEELLATRRSTVSEALTDWTL